MIVRSPNKTHNGLTAGVQFTNGFGETDRPAALAYFRRAGYTVTAGTMPHPTSQAASPASKPTPAAPGDVPAASPFAPTAPAAKSLSQMNKSELQAIASEKGLSTEGSNRELINRIREAQG